MRQIKNMFLLFAFFNVMLLGQTVTPDDIIKNIKSKSTEINDYIVDVEANINLQKVRVPKAKIKVYFKQPDKFHYDSKSFAMLPKAGFNFNLSNLIDDSFDIKVLKEEIIDNTNVYMLELKPKDIDTDGIEIKTYMWVDKKNWVMKRMVNETKGLLKMTVDCSYSYINNKHYLPSDIKYSIEPILLDSDDDTANAPNPETQRGKRRAGFLSSGEITLTFKNYIINSNFSDDIFKKKEELQKDEK